MKELYIAIKEFRMPDKLIRLIKTIIENGQKLSQNSNR